MPGLDYYLIAWDSSASVSLKVFRMLTVLKPAILNKWLKIQDLFLNFLALIKTEKREGERKTEILESNNVNWCWKKKKRENMENVWREIIPIVGNTHYWVGIYSSLKQIAIFYVEPPARMMRADHISSHIYSK